MSSGKKTIIQVSPEIKERLRKIRGKGETYNEVIKRILTSYEDLIFMEEQYKILDDNNNWVPLNELE